MATQVAATRLTLRGDGPWRGLTTLSRSAPFQYLELENCYVNQDGSELRTFPGFLCVIDPATQVRGWGSGIQNGYIDNHRAARRRVFTATSPYTFQAVVTQEQIVWTRPTCLHFAEQLGGRWIFAGESDHVREPILNTAVTGFVKVISYDDSGTDTDLTLDADCLTTADRFNTVQAGTPGDRIYLEGLTGLGAAALNGKGHNVLSFPAANVIRIDTSIGAMAAQTGQNGYIDRVTNPVVGSGVAPPTDDKESLTIWTSLERGNTNFAPSTRVFPAHVANRQRDFGDAVLSDSTGNIRQGNANLPGSPAGGRSRRRQRPIPYRLVPHLAGNQLIMVAPGYGCVFQAPGVIPTNFDEVSAVAGVNALCNDIYDMPRCLGVPKAVMWNDPQTGSGSIHLASIGSSPPSHPFAFGGSDAAVSGRNGTYQFKVAYRDEATGEIGLPSEPVSVTTGVSASFLGIKLFIYFPGYLMHECLALTVNLYRTAKDGTEFFFDRTIELRGFSGGSAGMAASSKYGLTPNAGTTEYFFHAILDCEYSADAVLQARLGVVPSIEQMPMGCKTARTVRGFTAFGGALGNVGSQREMQKGTLSLHYDFNTSGTGGINPKPDHVMSAFTNDWDTATLPIPSVSFEGVETGFGCGARNIPPAYMGQDIATIRLLPHPRKLFTLNKLENTHVGSDPLPANITGHIPDVRYSILDTPVRPESDIDADDANTETRIRDAFLMLPRSRVQFSEPDHPGVTPTTSVTVLANEYDHDIEGIGDSGGQLVVCTRDRTYAISSSQSPVGVPPDIVNDKFGCISANSMVTFDGGCAWISARGPVVMAGGVVHIGAPLERFFVGQPGRYLKSSDGMLRHSFACHDAERNLLYFGVFAGRAGTSVTGATPNPLTVSYRGASYTWDAAASVLEDGLPVGDQIRSRFPADEVLVYAYKADAWSVWRPPLNLGIQWMTRGQDGEGNYRVFFLSHDMRLYVLDDAYGNGSKDSFQATIAEPAPFTTGSLSTITFTTTVSERSMVGLKVVIYKAQGTAEPAVLRGIAEVVSQTASSITLSSAITVTNGDKIIVGAREMTIHTTFANIRDSAASNVVKVGIRHQQNSRYSQGVAGAAAQQSFASATVRTEEPRDGVLTAVEASFSRESFESPTAYQWLQQDEPDRVRDHSFDRGRTSGPNHQVKLSVIGGAQVRLHDLYLEVV